MSLNNEDLTADEQALLKAQVPRYSKYELSQIAARRAAQEFIDGTPSFHPSEANLNLLVEWMIKMDLEPSVQSFEKAYAVLQDVFEEAPKSTPMPRCPQNKSHLHRSRP